MHVAHLRRIERSQTVHGRLIVPDHQIKLFPLVRIDKLSLRRVFDQIAQEGASLRNRPSDDRSGMRGEIKRLSPRRRMSPNQSLLYRRELPALYFRKVAKADLGSREQLAVLAYQSLALGLDFVVKHVIGGSHVGEFRIAALRWNYASR